MRSRASAPVSGTRLFESGVRDMLIKQGKIKIHQDVINRLIGNYRSS